MQYTRFTFIIVLMTVFFLTSPVFSQSFSHNGKTISCADVRALASDQDVAQAFLSNKKASAMLKQSLQNLESKLKQRTSEAEIAQSVQALVKITLDVQGLVSQIQGIIAAKGALVGTIAAVTGAPLSLKALLVATTLRTITQGFGAFTAYKNFQQHKLQQLVLNTKSQVYQSELAAQRAWDTLMKAKELKRRYCH